MTECDACCYPSCMPKTKTPPAKRNRLPVVATIAPEVRTALAARCGRTGETASIIVEAALRSFLGLPPPAAPPAPILPAPGA